LAFQIGDKVVYPNHGIGVVEDVLGEPGSGPGSHFYKLRILANATRVMVPVANVEGVGLRRVISQAEVDRIFDLLENKKIEQHSNWKGRYKDNSDKMRSGSIYDVAGVLKSLSYLSKRKSLSFREKRMLDRARFLIVSEVAEVARESHEVVEQKIDIALARGMEAKRGKKGPSLKVLFKKTASLAGVSTDDMTPARARTTVIRKARARSESGNGSARKRSPIFISINRFS
jgi:CarD family transcriptional regulator